MSNTSLETRFWAKVVRRRGCWKWTACRNPRGYGMIQVRSGRCDRAHRVSWRLHVGEIPKGLCVLHRCDNPQCCNPRHLFLGTRKDNNVDKAKKGRAVGLHGEAHPAAKLRVRDLVRIRTLCLRMTQREVAKMFGVSRAAIGYVIQGKTWRSA